MSWPYAIIKFLQLILGMILFTLFLYTLIVWYGRNQVYSRIDHPVLNKLSDIVYLNKDQDGFVLKKPEATLPIELQKTQFLKLNTELDRYELDPDSPCVFMQLNFDTSRTSNYDEIIDPIKDLECVFIQTPYANAKNYFSNLKPRWFYGVRLSQWLQFVFLNSLFLEAAAPLDGDFVVINQSPSDLNPRLLAEVKRRRLILFAQE